MLGGGFKYFWNFHPYFGKMNPSWRAYFSGGVGSTTKQHGIHPHQTTIGRIFFASSSVAHHRNREEVETERFAEVLISRFEYTPGSTNSNIAGWKMDQEWRCISMYFRNIKWGYPSAMLVYWRVCFKLFKLFFYMIWVWDESIPLHGH